MDGERGGKQPQMRRNYNVLDQWGRKWLISIEKETGDITGNPEACFTDPLQTPPMYMRVDPMRPFELAIDYDRWIVDLRNARRDWDNNRLDVGRSLYGSQFDPDAEPTLELTRIIGHPPRDPADVIQAQAGNREWLGLPQDGSTYPTDEPAPKSKRRKSDPQETKV